MNRIWWMVGIGVVAAALVGTAAWSFRRPAEVEPVVTPVAAADSAALDDLSETDGPESTSRQPLSSAYRADLPGLDDGDWHHKICTAPMELPRDVVAQFVGAETKVSDEGLHVYLPQDQMAPITLGPADVPGGVWEIRFDEKGACHAVLLMESEHEQARNRTVQMIAEHEGEPVEPEGGSPNSEDVIVDELLDILEDPDLLAERAQAWDVTVEEAQKRIEDILDDNPMSAVNHLELEEAAGAAGAPTEEEREERNLERAQ